MTAVLTFNSAASMIPVRASLDAWRHRKIARISTPVELASVRAGAKLRTFMATVRATGAWYRNGRRMKVGTKNRPRLTNVSKANSQRSAFFREIIFG